MLNPEVVERFNALYPHEYEFQTAFCPYRICPIGAHIDHQYGNVTGFAIEKGVAIAYTPTANGVIELTSMNFPGRAQMHVSDIPAKQGDWADYLRGAAVALSKKHELRRGVYAVIEGQLPIGGLSSSAAVIIAFLRALSKANGIALDRDQLIQIAQDAENQYIGVSVGKLDQSCEVLCRRDHLLYLDTQDDQFELIPRDARMKPFEIAIFFSGVERTLVGSAYNMRVDELKAAAYALKGYAGIPYGKFEDTRLREVPEDVFETYKDRLPENWRKRATHFYTEMRRVRLGADAFRAGDIEKFGRYVFESGNSSIVNYETGSPELIALNEIMHATDGVYGGRFSGAGFKGCCMALIDPAYADEIGHSVTKEYLARFPKLEGKFSVHFTDTADGCRVD